MTLKQHLTLINIFNNLYLFLIASYYNGLKARAKKSGINLYFIIRGRLSKTIHDFLVLFTIGSSLADINRFRSQVFEDKIK